MKNILIMHTGGWIGDMVLLTPALRALKSKLPDCRMTMLVRPLVSELMERNPYLDEIVVYDKHGGQKGFRGMIAMAKQLRAKSFDTAIILHPNSVSSALIAYMAHIPQRVGLRLAGNGLFLNTRVDRRSDIHEVQRYLDIVAPIAGTGFSDKLEFWGIGHEDEEFAKSVTADLDSKIAGINISTTWQTKRWKIERFARLAELLHNQLGIKSILTGGKSDIQIGQQIMKIAPDPDTYILDLTGRTTLWQLGAIIGNCDSYITCDSGPMHISAALDTSTIALFGPTDPVRHRPYGDGHIAMRNWRECGPCYRRECKKGALCMESIQAEDVFEIIETQTIKQTGD